MKIEIMARTGHELLAEVSENTSRGELQWINQQFRELRRRGYNAFGVRSGQRVKSFSTDLNEDIVFIAPLVGG